MGSGEELTRAIDVIEAMKETGLFVIAVKKGIVSGSLASKAEIYTKYLTNAEGDIVTRAVRKTAVECGCAESWVYRVVKEMEG